MSTSAGVAGRWRLATARLDGLLGGPRRRHVVLVFACVLALDSADAATVGAGATQLESGLGIGRTQIGLLLTASSLVGALATLPFGMLVDRTCRVRLLGYGVATWGVAMLLSGLATGYEFLLLSRIALGAVLAVAGPAVASLLGDYFPSEDRGRIYGFVISGELVGAAVGFEIAGQFAVLSWRAPFLFLVAPSLIVWWLVRRLPEPERTEADEAVSLRQAVRYVLRVRTNVVLIVASALGYFYFSGLRGFAVEFAKQHYHVSQAGASALILVLGAGALAGVLSGGRLADRLIRRGRRAARVEVAGVAVLAAGTLFVPALVTTNLWLAVLLLALASACLGATSPPLDAARLDIIRPSVWGRAESIRTVLRSGADAGAPLLFGVFADSVFGGSTGLQYTFLVMLAVLFAAAVLALVLARRSYPADAAAAAGSTRDRRTIASGPVRS